MKTIKLFLSIVLLTIASNTFADNLVVEDFAIDPGSTKTISIELVNPDSEYIMIEFWMSLPDGVSIPMDEDGYYLAEGNSSRFKRSHSLEVSEQNGFYHFLIFSSRNEALKGNSGELISVTLEAAPDAQVGTHTAKIFNQLYNDPNKNEVTPEDVFFNITIGSSNVQEQTLSYSEIPAKTYGDAPFTLPATTNEGQTLVWTSSDTNVATISGNTLTVKGAGTATITASQEGNNDYMPFTKDFTLTVAKAPLTITAKSYTITQGEALPTFEATYAGFVNNETASVLTKQPTFSCSATSNSTPGTYTITPSGATAANYTFTYVNGTLTIMGNQSIDLAEIPAMTYGDAAYTLPQKTTQGLTITWTSSNTNVATISGNKLTIKGAGTATITATVSGNDNYNAFTKDYTLTVNKAPLTITAKSYTITQGEPLPIFEATYAGFVNNETASVLTKQPTFSCSATSNSAPDTYTITPSGAEAANYTFTYVNGTLTIMGNQSIDLTEIPAMTYGDAAYTLPQKTTQGLTITWTSSNTNVATISGNKLTIKGAGTATITATASGNDHYNAFTKDYILTVNKAPLTITAKSYTITQGEALPTFEATYTGFVNNETASVLTKQPTFSCSATSNSDPGTYTITPSGATAVNYEISYVNGKLIIMGNQGIGLAEIPTMTYGDNPFTLPATTNEGQAITWTSGNTNVATISGNTLTIKGAGTATITANVSGNNNYNAFTKDYTLTVNKAALTITAKSYTITQGEALPTFEATYAGFVNNETASVLTKQPTFSCSATSSSDPGTYTITPSGAAAANYEISYVNGTLTIEVADSFITFEDNTVKTICVYYWDTNKDGELSMTEAAAVTNLGSAFLNRKNITSFNELQYFTGLTSIITKAFINCSSLTSITIPSNVTSIGNEAFAGCSSLAPITIPNSVTSIGDYAFSSCYSLTAITIPNSVTSIGDYAFNSCSGLTSVTIPNSVTSIGFAIFSFCSNLTSIMVDSESTKYDSRNNCNAIIETSSNTLIGGCKNTFIPNSVTSIGEGAFYACSELATITIPNSVTSIGAYAFTYCASLTSITIPNGVTSIEENVFAVCSSLTSVTIPNSVTSIGKQAFNNCKSLTSITIPNSVTSIGKSAFNYCSNLTSVTVENPTPVSIEEYTFSNRTKATLYVPAGSKDTYIAADYWKEFKFIIENDNRSEQSLSYSELPAMTYGDAVYTLPQKTTEGLTITWTSSNIDIATISNNTLTIVGAGVATITATQEGNDDYKPFTMEFTLTVAKAPLKITANDCERHVGEENPVFTLTYEGFVNGDDETCLTTQPTVTTTATATSPIGNYPIVVSGASSPNYDITYVNGTLTVLEETGITEMNAAKNDAPTYNMQGIRIKSNSRGIVIKNGKKYVNK